MTKDDTLLFLFHQKKTNYPNEEKIDINAPIPRPSENKKAPKKEAKPQVEEPQVEAAEAAETTEA